MVRPAHVTDSGRQSVWSDSKAVLTLEADFFHKLKHTIALAAKYPHAEAFSYGTVNRIFEAFATVHIDHAKRRELECHPQMPFANYDSAGAVKRDSNSVAGKQIPDYTIFPTTHDESEGELDSVQLGFWVEVKRFISDDNEGDLVLLEAIEQMHVQAAFAFDSLSSGENSYHAFVIALNYFSLLRYTRPGTIDQTNADSTPGTDNGLAGLDLNIPGVPPMPDIPVVIYWNQPIFTPQLKKFSAVFLEALHCATEHLQFDRQPSWFDRRAGATTARAKKLLRENQERGQTLVNRRSATRARTVREIHAALAAEDALTPPNSERKDATYVHEAESTTTSPATPKIKKGQVKGQRRKKNSV